MRFVCFHLQYFTEICTPIVPKITQTIINIELQTSVLGSKFSQSILLMHSHYKKS
jgi:hypothetical protein